MEILCTRQVVLIQAPIVGNLILFFKFPHFVFQILPLCADHLYQLQITIPQYYSNATHIHE